METRPRGALVAALVALAGVAAFLLLRPFLGPLDAYRPRPPGTTYAYSFVIVAAFIPYAVAAWASRDGVSLGLAVGGGCLLAALLLPAAATQSQDLYAYLFYGKLWSILGANPYVVAPETFAGDAWYPWLRWRDQLSVYGPVWTLASGAAARASAGNLAIAFALMKVVTGALFAATVAGLVRAARDRGHDPGRTVLLFAWNPLVLVALPLGAHADGAIAAAAVWALVADRRGRPLAAVALLATVALVKAYAGLLLLLYLVALWRRRGPALRAVGLAGALAAAAFAPFWIGLSTFDGLLDIAGSASSSLTGWLQSSLELVLPLPAAVWTVRAIAIVVVAGVVVFVVRRPTFALDPWPGITAALAAFILVTPWYLYWYGAALVALAAVAASRPLRAAGLTFSGSSMLTVSGGATPWGVALQTIVRYAAPAVAWRLARRGERPRAGTAERAAADDTLVVR